MGDSTMNLPNSFTKRGTIKIAILVALAALGHSRLSSSDAHQATGAMTLPGVLEKRDAYTCYGRDAKVTECQAALNQLQPFEDKNLEVYSGTCLNWSQDTCNVRFCAQPYVATTVNRTASWIYNWANNSLMNCVHGGQYSVMGDSVNLNGNGGTYRLYLEHATPSHS
ncbi:hypothetical protein F5B17DRAFT_448408 [Nemania serpens]|nr:hypothetical protein F5B17DRAFT_448408 [Nemania serpens]